jgi:hypothetical protein
LQRFIQRCIGRALRHKTNPKHPSPDLSRVVIFEVSLDDEDQDTVKNANLQVAIRIKAICSGIDFTDTLMLAVPPRRRAEADRERERFRLQINSLQNNEILQRILRESAAGASANELVTMFCKQCAKYGTAITPILAISLLMQYDVIDKNDRIALEEIIRKRDRRLSKLSFSEFMNDPEVKAAIKKLKVIGITDYFGIINGLNDINEIERILIRFNANSARENKRKLIALAKSGGKRPNSSARQLEEKRLGAALVSYTREKSESYDKSFNVNVRGVRPDWFVDTAAENKAELIKMAKAGKKKPRVESESRHEKRLAYALKSYTNRNNRDQAFNAQIRDLRPDWFVNIAAENKAKLIKMAKEGKRRPSAKTQLGARLCEYVSEKKSSYDSDFAADINALRPDWFVNIAAENKAKLIKMAKEGKRRPSAKTQLGDKLRRYISNDSEFASIIRVCRPDWFIDTAAPKKARLLQMAEMGKKRPSASSGNRTEKQLGRALYNYTNRHIDSEFNVQIRALRPDWFVDTTTENKAELIRMAEMGKKRPSTSSGNRTEKQLGRCLCRYASSDSEFKATVASIRPDWFVDTAAENKAELIMMAKAGKGRPTQSFVKDGRRLGIVLTTYVSENNGNYDQEFDMQIRALRPDWFVDTATKTKVQLLAIAKAGKKKPAWSSSSITERRFADRLGDYLNKNSTGYDPVFSKQIRSLRPDWFTHNKVKRGKYAGRNEYREFLVKALKYYGLTYFSDCEFWTLGGKEWYEYKHLVDAGIELNPNSYHNVDNGIIDKAPDGACAHSSREFLTIHKLWNRWKNPRVISYDATMGMVENRTEYWQELCYLAIAAAKKSGYVLFSWNFMEGYKRSSYKPIEKGVYKHWLQSLKGFAESEGLQIDFYTDGQITKRPTSQTPMLAGCCKMTKICSVSKAS